MKLKSDRWRRALAGGALIASLGLCRCGGGQQVQAFRRTGVIAFGDESSVIDDSSSTANGRKYSVNGDGLGDRSDAGLQAASALDPGSRDAVRPVFPQCNNGTTPVASPSEPDSARRRRKVADLRPQIDAQQAESAFTPKDLAWS
jgi:hypothetical protein